MKYFEYRNDNIRRSLGNDFSREVFVRYKKRSPVTHSGERFVSRSAMRQAFRTSGKGHFLNVDVVT